MAKFIVLKDIAILYLGEGDGKRYVIIDGVSVDDYGSLSPKSLEAAKKALSNEAVKNGATRIHQSDCVDFFSGGVEASDDMVVAFNGGDVIYTSLQTGFAIEKFMIRNNLLLPSSKFKIPRTSSDKDILKTAKEILYFLPTQSKDEAIKIIDLILQESRITHITQDDEKTILRYLQP